MQELLNEIKVGFSRERDAIRDALTSINSSASDALRTVESVIKRLDEASIAHRKGVEEAEAAAGAAKKSADEHESRLEKLKRDIESESQRHEEDRKSRSSAIADLEEKSGRLRADSDARSAENRTLVETNVGLRSEKIALERDISNLKTDRANADAAAEKAREGLAATLRETDEAKTHLSRVSADSRIIESRK